MSSPNDEVDFTGTLARKYRIQGTSAHTSWYLFWPWKESLALQKKCNYGWLCGDNYPRPRDRPRLVMISGEGRFPRTPLVCYVLRLFPVTETADLLPPKAEKFLGEWLQKARHAPDLPSAQVEEATTPPAKRQRVNIGDNFMCYRLVRVLSRSYIPCTIRALRNAAWASLGRRHTKPQVWFPLPLGAPGSGTDLSAPEQMGRLVTRTLRTVPEQNELLTNIFDGAWYTDEQFFVHIFLGSQVPHQYHLINNADQCSRLVQQVTDPEMIYQAFFVTNPGLGVSELNRLRYVQPLLSHNFPIEPEPPVGFEHCIRVFHHLRAIQQSTGVPCFGYLTKNQDDCQALSNLVRARAIMVPKYHPPTSPRVSVCFPDDVTRCSNIAEWLRSINPWPVHGRNMTLADMLGSKVHTVVVHGHHILEDVIWEVCRNAWDEVVILMPTAWQQQKVVATFDRLLGSRPSARVLAFSDPDTMGVLPGLLHQNVSKIVIFGAHLMEMGFFSRLARLLLANPGPHVTLIGPPLCELVSGYFPGPGAVGPYRALLQSPYMLVIDADKYFEFKHETTSAFAILHGIVVEGKGRLQDLPRLHQAPATQPMPATVYWCDPNSNPDQDALQNIHSKLLRRHQMITIDSTRSHGPAAPGDAVVIQNGMDVGLFCSQTTGPRDPDCGLFRNPGNQPGKSATVSVFRHHNGAVEMRNLAWNHQTIAHTGPVVPEKYAQIIPPVGVVAFHPPPGQPRVSSLLSVSRQIFGDPQQTMIIVTDPPTLQDLDSQTPLKTPHGANQAPDIRMFNDMTGV